MTEEKVYWIKLGQERLRGYMSVMRCTHPKNVFVPPRQININLSNKRKTGCYTLSKYAHTHKIILKMKQARRRGIFAQRVYCQVVRTDKLT